MRYLGAMEPGWAARDGVQRRLGRFRIAFGLALVTYSAMDWIYGSRSHWPVAVTIAQSGLSVGLIALAISRLVTFRQRRRLMRHGR